MEEIQEDLKTEGIVGTSSKLPKTKWYHKIAPVKIIAFSFFAAILLGALILWLPISTNPGVHLSFVDSLFTATSAVCVTGLNTISPGDTFNVFGRSVVAFLIQIGGLGVTSIGVGIILIAGRRVGLKHRTLVREAWNVSSLQGIVRLVRAVLLMTLGIELMGAILSFFVFVQHYPVWDAVGISLFHSIAAFNNSGFDILGGFQNLIPYQKDVLLNLTTCVLIILGGIGYLVIIDVWKSRSFHKLTLHSKAVISTTVILLAVGTVLLKLTDHITWLGAFFQSTSARTAGFSSYPIGDLTNASLLVLIVLMFIGASPGSTGGGIKTTTLFVMIRSVRSICTNQRCEAYRRQIRQESIYKAFMITILAAALVILGTFLLCILEPSHSLMQLLFETTSAFGTVGLSTGITPTLAPLSKLVLILIMYIGRLGPLTFATLWFIKQPTSVRYTEEMITIG